MKRSVSPVPTIYLSHWETPQRQHCWGCNLPTVQAALQNGGVGVLVIRF